MEAPIYPVQPQIVNQEGQRVPQPAQTFLPRVCQPLVDKWVTSRLIEAKHLNSSIAHKRLQLTKLVNHSANGTFPTNIRCSEPNNQYPNSIDPAVIAAANEEEIQAALTFKRAVLKIRTRELAQDLKVHEDKLKVMLHFESIMHEAEAKINHIPKTAETLGEIANTFLCEYELQQMIFKESSLKQKTVVVPPKSIDEMMVDAAGTLDDNQVASLQRNQEIMLKKIRTLESRLKQQKNGSGRGSGGIPQGKPDHKEARGRSASRGRSKQRSSSKSKNRAKSNASNKSGESKTSSKTSGQKERKGKGSQEKGHSKEQAAKGKSKR